MDRNQKADEQLVALAAHLGERRDLILQAWRKCVEADPELTAPASLPRTQFNDHIPDLLDALEHTLREWPHRESGSSKVRRTANAASHGLQRWQQGYNLREVTREWAHLHLCLAGEMETYAEANDQLEPRVMSTAWRAIAELCSQGVSESTSQYFHLQQTEAEGHVRDLQETLSEVRDLERRRTALFRQAAHDLRGNFGVVANVTSGLTEVSIPDSVRDEFLSLLHKSVLSLHTMLDEVMDLARLQAGQELRDLKTLDVATMLRELTETLQPLANTRGLYLKATGPDSLLVEGDSIKIKRIAQNLVLNALKCTSSGGVTVTWGNSRNNDPMRWMLCVQDTGPGYHAGPGSPLVGALEEATEEARQVEKHSPAHHEHTSKPNTAAAPSHDHRPNLMERGEGIGLSIVKRLCELLDATVELQSSPDEGTTFRVVLPRNYQPLAPEV